MKIFDDAGRGIHIGAVRAGAATAVSLASVDPDVGNAGACRNIQLKNAVALVADALSKSNAMNARGGLVANDREAFPTAIARRHRLARMERHVAGKSTGIINTNRKINRSYGRR